MAEKFNDYLERVVFENLKLEQGIKDPALTKHGVNTYFGDGPIGYWKREAMRIVQEFDTICEFYCKDKINKEHAIKLMSELELQPLVLTEAIDHMYNRKEEKVTDMGVAEDIYQQYKDRCKSCDHTREDHSGSVMMNMGTMAPGPSTSCNVSYDEEFMDVYPQFCKCDQFIDFTPADIAELIEIHLDAKEKKNEDQRQDQDNGNV